MGLVDMFNGLDIEQTQDYVKVSCSTYITRVCEKYQTPWMHSHMMRGQPTPFPTTQGSMSGFLSTEGDPDEKVQAKLALDMKCQYRNVVGELIYAMTTCRPDISNAVI